MASQAADVGSGWRRGADGVPAEGWTAPDAGRRLQLVLAAIWLLDGLLQFQAFMFSRDFAQLLGTTAAGNPAIVADPITWSARIIAGHPTATNATFALIQLALGLGIAWRPTLKLALASSVVWSLAVWWFGEGLGGVLNGTASPVTGAPGAVIIYALLAVLLWPPARDQSARDQSARDQPARDQSARDQPARDQPAPFLAGRFTGVHVARVLWLVLWGSLAWLAVLPATRAPKAFGGLVAGMASGEPGWLARTDDQLGAFLTRHGPAAAVVLAIALALVAMSVYLSRPAVRAGVVLALVMAAFLWIAQGLGGMLAGGGTDPDSGPLLALVALAYWPLARPAWSGRPEPPAAPEGA